MKLLVAFSAVLALGLGSNLRYDELKFAQFKEQFGKQYQTRSHNILLLFYLVKLFIFSLKIFVIPLLPVIDALGIDLQRSLRLQERLLQVPLARLQLVSEVDVELQL